MCNFGTVSKNCLRLRPSAYARGQMGWSQKSLERLEGKTKEAPFFKVQSGRITACLVSLLGTAQNAQRPPL